MTWRADVGAQRLALGGLLGALIAGVGIPTAALADGAVIACDAEKTYFPAGERWAAVPALGDNPIVYRVQKDGAQQADPLPMTAIRYAVGRAFDAWQEVECGNGRPNLAIVDGYERDGQDYPTRDRGDDLEAASADAWVLNNVVYFVTDANAWVGDALTLAVTTRLSAFDTGEIVTADIEINNVDFVWGVEDATGVHQGCVGGDDCQNLFGTLLHEVGHFLGFEHVQCGDAVMFPNGGQWNALSPHEAAGVCAIYPPRPEGLEVSKRVMGERCDSDNACWAGACMVSAVGVGYCTKACSTTAHCPEGWVCETETWDGACVPGVHSIQGVRASADTVCGAGQFACQSGECISTEYRCDGWLDCSNGADEESCTRNGEACEAPDFHCPLDLCIPAKWVCDGTPDCLDAADETGCACDAGEAACVSACLAPSLVCDGTAHCDDAFDEEICGGCSVNNLSCGDGTCVGTAQMCDGVADCASGVDEAWCGKSDRDAKFVSLKSSGDLCDACTEHAHCGSGLCVVGGDDGESVCSQRCEPDTVFGCPDGFTCLGVNEIEQIYACFPDADNPCLGRQDTRVGNNGRCYGESDDFFATCAPGLVCFRFRERAEGQEGNCVGYCNRTDHPCSSGYTCCNTVDPNTGECIPPTEGFDHGGCFDLRSEGETCVLADQAICGLGLMCLQKQEGEVSRCYKLCTDDVAVCTGEDQLCTGLNLTDGSTIGLCCNGDALHNTGLCEPARECFFDIGVACERDSDCREGRCLTYTGRSACTRACNAITGVGCPRDIDDVNEDGIADGGFDCLDIAGVGQCWPKSGEAIVPPSCAEGKKKTAGCGCFGVDTGLDAVAWLLGLGVVVGLRRRRRRA